MNCERLNAATDETLVDLGLGKVELVWTHHALVRASEKQIRQRTKLAIKAGRVVEAERTVRAWTKLVVRVPAGGRWDHVFVLVPTAGGRWRVVTVWRNHRHDTHTTLKKERLGKLG